MGLPDSGYAWDRAAPDDLYFDGRTSNGEAPPEVKALYADLARATMGGEERMTSGYVFDQSYIRWKGVYHGGIDIDGDGGQTVRTPIGGTIVHADTPDDGWGYDSKLFLKGDDSRFWLFGHVQEAMPWQDLDGRRVEAGDAVAKLYPHSNDHLHLGVLTTLPNAYPFSTVGGWGRFKTEAAALNHTINPLEAYHQVQEGSVTTGAATPRSGGAGRDQMNGGGGEDILKGEGGNDVLQGYGGTDLLFGDNGSDVLKGGNGKDALLGGDGSDRLFGNSDSDLLYGGDGNDQIAGGWGPDQLFGGGGADRFVYYNWKDSTATTTSVDNIYNFEIGRDTIDLRGIDADTTQSGDQAFRLVDDATGDRPGEVTVDADEGWIHASVDTKPGFELTISIEAGLNLTAGDFLL